MILMSWIAQGLQRPLCSMHDFCQALGLAISLPHCSVRLMPWSSGVCDPAMWYGVASDLANPELKSMAKFLLELSQRAVTSGRALRALLKRQRCLE